MDAVIEVVLILALSIIIALCGYGLSQEITKKTREYPSYCIDPFASVDMGQHVYTNCKLVPMWSMKV